MSSNGIQGNLLGISRQKQDEISRLFRRRIPADQVTTHEFNRELCALSHEIGRQIGTLLNRRGQVESVVVGGDKSLLLGDVGRSRGDPARFRGLRYVHTHLKPEPLSEEDLTDLGLLRLDLVLAVTVDEQGYPGPSYLAHLLPYNQEGRPYEVYPPFAPGQLDMDFQELMRSLEEEFARTRPKLKGRDREGVILVSVQVDEFRANSPLPAAPRIDSMAELMELARSAGVDVLDQVVQRRPKAHPRTVLGPGKLQEVVVRAMQLGAVTLIFDRELSPSQVNAIQKLTELKVIDRSQLILDIFAQRAKSREGKIQVELAQLRYNLPRLAGHGVDMSRLTGGIGSRGPGETKLEIDRRRVRERIHRQERELENIRRTRAQKRERRKAREVPVVSIIGYTNAGKSTLLNQLTDSTVDVEDKMFATLDPTSRRLRFPREREIVITDTVGFIHELPKDLMEAFRATLEELADADLFLHVVDAADPSWDGQISAVGKILEELEFSDKPRIIVFNKADLAAPSDLGARLARFSGSISISALNRRSFLPLLLAMERELFREKELDSTAWQSLGY
ncbi:MAG TPA: GTPase HflX [bacterium]|nr:GTPase HflX [bacterium]